MLSIIAIGGQAIELVSNIFYELSQYPQMVSKGYLPSVIAIDVDRQMVNLCKERGIDTVIIPKKYDTLHTFNAPKDFALMANIYEETEDDIKIQFFEHIQTLQVENLNKILLVSNIGGGSSAFLIGLLKSMNKWINEEGVLEVVTAYLKKPKYIFAIVPLPFKVQDKALLNENVKKAYPALKKLWNRKDLFMGISYFDRAAFDSKSEFDDTLHQLLTDLIIMDKKGDYEFQKSLSNALNSQSIFFHLQIEVKCNLFKAPKIWRTSMPFSDTADVVELSGNKLSIHDAKPLAHLPPPQSLSNPSLTALVMFREPIRKRLDTSKPFVNISAFAKKIGKEEKEVNFSYQSVDSVFPNLIESVIILHGLQSYHAVDEAISVGFALGRNIELQRKFRVSDDEMEALEREVKGMFARCRLESEIFQDDTYFDGAGFTDVEYLRLREYEGEYYLTLKMKTGVEQAIGRERLEWEIQIQDGESMKELLKKINITPIATIKKTRKIYKCWEFDAKTGEMWEFNLHFDDVDELGLFVEVQKNVSANKETEGRGFLDEIVVNRLELQNEVKESYLELVSKSNGNSSPLEGG